VPIRARAEGMLDAFGRLGCGAILVDRDGQVFQLNDEARKHLGLTIQIVHGQLTASDRLAKERLQQLVGSVAARGGDWTGGTDTVVLPRPKGWPVVAYVAPIPTALREIFPDGGAIILLVDPNADREPLEPLLQAFALTPAETRLAVGLAKGHDLRSLAQIHKVSVGTLRMHLKSVFAKTNTKRQAELLMLLAKLSLRPK
jgi:DNA-binding CsgD family transcriptional regulator